MRHALVRGVGPAEAAHYALTTADGLFVEWLPFSLLSGGKRSKNWVRSINRAIEDAKTPA